MLFQFKQKQSVNSEIFHIVFNQNPAPKWGPNQANSTIQAFFSKKVKMHEKQFF
jgi:hypothetical protein